ncbi:MAG TPA: Gfo/Idh/MocA family oxidoreductase [Acidobacteriaceae bacterium]
MHASSSLNRRHFTQLSAMALAATQLPAQPVKRVGYAAVGLGIISDIFMTACAQSRSAKVTGLVTGHPADKGTRYAAQYNVPAKSIYTYETFDRIRDNPDIDAVYIGLPNSMHCEYTIRAAEAGKHVLCEKPMAISSAECRRMIDACRKANVRLMIAYRIQYDPTFARVAELIRSGALGQIQAFDGAFPGYEPAGAWRLNRKLAGGGSLFDLGIYPLNTIRFLTGEEPSTYAAMVATRDTSGRFAEMEQSIAWTMKFPSGILASCSSSYGQDGENFLRVRGDKGWLQVQPAYNYDGIRLVAHTLQGNIDEPAMGKKPFQFVLEADHFASCVRNNTQPRTPGEEGLKDLLAIEAIYNSAGTPVG